MLPIIWTRVMTSMSGKLLCRVVAIGAWGRFFSDWNQLASLLQGTSKGFDGNPASPNPEIIPSNERRRAPLSVKLAVEASSQCLDMAGTNGQDLSCVFGSGLGDTDLTDYMCKVLASENKELSPTKFHNSVHNAPAGYWTISTKAMRSANSIAGYGYTASLALLEAMIQCEIEKAPILLSLYDSPVTTILKPILKNEMPFALSLLLMPVDFDHSGWSVLVEAESTMGEFSWPALTSDHTGILELYDKNPSARILCLAELLCSSENFGELTMPLSSQTGLYITAREW